MTHLCGALEFVPIEGFAVDGALDRLEQNDGEDLAVSESLQPDVEEQPSVALVGGVAALQRKAMARGDKVDEQKCAEVGEQLFEARGGSGFGMVVAIDEIVDASRRGTSGR